MASIVEKLNEIPQMYHAKGCTDEQIQNAEQALGISFPEDFQAYVKAYGAISFYATEWTGLNVDMDSAGEIYTVQYEKKEHLCSSLMEYLNICLNRHKQ